MKPPAWLSKEAKAEWRRVHPQLVSRETLTDADYGLLESYCIAIGQIQQCERELRAGLTVLNAQGDLKPHPALRVQHAAIAHARACARQLGLTPASRGSAQPVRKEAENDWAGLA